MSSSWLILFVIFSSFRATKWMTCWRHIFHWCLLQWTSRGSLPRYARSKNNDHGNQHEAATHERRLFHPHYKLQNQQLRDTAHFVTFPTLSIGMTHGTNYSSGNYRLFLFNQVWTGTSPFIWMKFSFPNESSNTPTPSTSLYLLPNKATCYRSEMELIGVLCVKSDW